MQFKNMYNLKKALSSAEKEEEDAEEMDEEEIVEEMKAVCCEEWVAQVQEVFGLNYSNSEYFIQYVEAGAEAANIEPADASPSAPSHPQNFHIDFLDASLHIGSNGDALEDDRERRSLHREMEEGRIKYYRAADSWLY